ncbi:hypothetical protein PR048_009840 [Dryococelus australis]|uniref:Uncharacterized protein n=1 Tax=Dryococelus australis TaxID=614101 RepID=A0ABQ9I1G3_9NEOP|nr:hypothetical protein PR048_009840 [Dryococelus australis]
MSGLFGSNFRDVNSYKKKKKQLLLGHQKKKDEELEVYLQYEVASFPLSLFVALGMRITKKSATYALFLQLLQEPNFGKVVHIMDEGYILHRYYIESVVVIFDYYPENTSTKSAESLRRSRVNQSSDSNFDETIECASQEKFLSNEKKKKKHDLSKCRV